jgi:hypothetical protein
MVHVICNEKEKGRTEGDTMWIYILYKYSLKERFVYELHYLFASFSVPDVHNRLSRRPAQSTGIDAPRVK